MSEEEGIAPFWDHLDQLRGILIRSLLSIALCGALALVFSKEILQFLTSTLPEQNTPLLLLSPQEGMLTLFKLAFWSGLILSFPYWAFLFASFIRPALNRSAQIALPVFLIVSGLFVSAGLALSLLVTIPLANNYLYQFNETLGENFWSFSAYFDYVLLLLFAHAAAFEAGALMLLLVHLRVLPWHMLAEKRRHAIVGSLILAALITPPDILTQILLAIPLYGFFELSILYGKFISPGYEQDHSYHAHLERDATHPQAN